MCVCVRVFARRRRATTEVTNGQPLRTRVQKCAAKVRQKRKRFVQMDKMECVCERSFYSAERPVMCSVCLLIRLHGSGMCALLRLSTEAVVHEMIAWLAPVSNPVIQRGLMKTEL